jgi:hypothetical protein
MKYKDPTNQLLEAYQTLLEGKITYGGQAVTVGTRIPRRRNRYVMLFIEAINNYSTGDKAIYNATMAIQIVDMQDLGEGDESVANAIMEQILPLVDNPKSFPMADFVCLTANFGDMEPANETNETNYIITKKLRMNHFIEQLNV